MAKKLFSYTDSDIKSSLVLIFRNICVLKTLLYCSCSIFFFLVLFHFSAGAQSLIPFTNNPRIISICGQGCTSIKLKSTNIKSSNDYLFKEVPYNHYNYTSTNGIEDSTFYNNFKYSSALNLPFPICFYDSLFTNFVVNPLGTITFDISNANCDVTYGWYLPLPGFGVADYPCNTGTYCYYPRATIMGIGTDLNPNINNDGSNFPVSPTDRKIEYRVEGAIPLRKFIVNYYKIATNVDSACSRLQKFATFQMVIQESTGIIEINIENFSCPPILINGGESICGIQNWARDKATTAPGKNATMWTAFQESYQFIPNGSSKRFINARLLDMNGDFIAMADTAIGIDSAFIDIAFNNICPVNDSTSYIVQHNYGGCQPFSVYDTITIVRNKNVAVAATVASSCLNNGTITINGSGDNFQFGIDGGMLQNNNIFNNVLPGSHVLQINGVISNCSRTIPVTVKLPPLILKTINDTTICKGEAVTITTLSDAVDFDWQPAAGLNNAGISNPVAKPDTSIQYIVRGVTGSCTGLDTLTVTIKPGPLVNAGSDITIVSGDNTQLTGSANDWFSLLWTPSIYLSDQVNILSPLVINPQQTTTYRLTALNSSNCSSYDEVKVIVLPNCIDIKNAFTPNGDGNNDTWFVYSQFDCIKAIAVQVYNRYGSKVYENKNYHNEWDGNYGGKPLPDATYYYVLSVQLVTGRIYELRGDVTILR